MDFEVLISCMFHDDFRIIEDSNLRNVPTLVINQTNCEKDNWEVDQEIHRRLDTNTRGLSVSRNLAIENAKGDICLLGDDDEHFFDGFEKLVLETYKCHLDADIICFRLEYPDRNLRLVEKKINYISALKIFSCQVSFKRKSIIDAGIKFDTNFGSGTPNGSGEENIFLYECLKKGLSIIYIPVNIGIITPSESKWFKGFNSQLFINQGKKAKRLMGCFCGTLYCVYFAIAKYNRYKNNVSFINALKYMFKGIWRNTQECTGE